MNASIPKLRPIVDRHGGWIWIVCAATGCGHYRPAAYVPFVIRWGENAWPDRLRRSARCSRCGHRGASLRTPSHTGSAERGIHPFPVERLERAKT